MAGLFDNERRPDLFRKDEIVRDMQARQRTQPSLFEQWQDWPGVAGLLGIPSLGEQMRAAEEAQAAAPTLLDKIMAGVGNPVAGAFSPADLGGLFAGPIVFHGSPHRWAAEPGKPLGRPDLSKVGTGEGNTAYGEGFYSAESPGVAKSYSLVFKPDFEKYNTDAAYRAAVNVRSNRGDVDKTLDILLDNIERARFPGNAVRARDAINAIKDGSYLIPYEEMQKSGFLYKLDLPDEEAAKYLDWDAPLSEQPEAVRKILGDFGALPLSPKEMLDKFLSSDFAKSFPDTSEVRIARRVAESGDPKSISDWAVRQSKSGNTGFNLFGAVGDIDWKSTTGEQFLSRVGEDALRDAGIPGIKYYDQMSRGEKQGTRNYVTWDQDLLDRMDVLERSP